jgi:phospholipid/cholesterol/gamma-HCH transport system substrate-binding protein
MEERRLEIKVGALLLAALAGTLGLLWLMGELSLGRVSTLSVEFGHTGNVVKGAPVKLGGVPIGRVEKIILTPDHRDEYGEPLPVQMELSVDPKVIDAMRADARVTVATQGPLGEPYLELYTGSAKMGALDKTRSIRGTDAPRLDLVANQLSNFLQSASRVLEEDPRALSTLVSGVSSLTKTVDGVLTENRTDIHTLASELSAAAKDLRLLSELARANLEPGGKGARFLDDASESAKVMRTNLPQLSADAKVALGGLAALSGGLTVEDGQKLKVAIDRYSSAGEKLDRIADRGDKILAKMEAGQGTAGAALKDPQLYNDLKELVSDLRKHPWKMLWKD